MAGKAAGGAPLENLSPDTEGHVHPIV